MKFSPIDLADQSWAVPTRRRQGVETSTERRNAYLPVGAASVQDCQPDTAAPIHPTACPDAGRMASPVARRRGTPTDSSETNERPGR